MKTTSEINMARFSAKLAFVVMFLICHTSIAQNVIAWGSNTKGQTNVPPSATNVIAVAAGWYHSLALRSDGTVVSWGAISNAPVEATNVVSIAAGAAHNLALRGDGSVIAWGDDTWGQTNAPVLATNVIAIAAGNYHNLALMADGTVAAWGRNVYGQTNVPSGLSNVVAVAAGTEHSMALKNDGSVIIWGGSSVYPLNSVKSAFPYSTSTVAAMSAGTAFNLYLNSPGKVYQAGYYTISPPSSATNIVAIAAGTNFSLALTTAGTLLGWGSTTATNPPASATNIIAMAVGLAHGLAVKGDGSPHLLGSPALNSFCSSGSYLPFFARAVGNGPLSYQWLADGVPINGATNAVPSVVTFMGNDRVAYQVVVGNALGCVTSSIVNVAVRALNIWGNNSDGQRLIPGAVVNPVAVVAGAFHNLVLQQDGTVAAFGDNTYGESTAPSSATNVISLAAGSYFSLALRNDGTVIAWGKNNFGQTNVPPSATNVVAIAAGWMHGLALRADGTVVAWGDNDFDQTNIPPNLTDVIAIAAGYRHNLALRSDHSIVAWGSQSTIPAPATNVVAIAAGFEHSLALTGTGRVIAWGDNTYGQCSVPSSVTNATAISAGWGHSMARLGDGTVVAWGKNLFGETNVPPGLNNVASISCGEDYELAMVGYGPPQIQMEPQTVTAHVGGGALLKADLAGTYPLASQWYSNSIPVVGATNCWLLLTNVQLSDAEAYSLMVSNSVGQASSAAPVNAVDPSPYFLTPLPTQQNALLGTPFSLTISAAGVQPLAYQSQLNGVNLEDNGRISGTASPSLCFEPTTFGDDGLLTMMVTNDFGSYTGLLANLAVTPVIGWGDNSAGQLQVPANITNVVSVASGGDHNLALLADGTVAAWGDNSYNQSSVPVSANQAFAIAEGDTHSLALKPDGSVIAWGDNSSTQTNVPSTVQNAVAIAAGTKFSQAVMPDGSVIQWGFSSYVPPAFTHVMLLSTKGTHSVALRADGTMVETGLGSVPIPQSYTNVVAICAGLSDSLALQADGRLVAWGKNLYGQTNVPPSANNIVAIAAGDDHFVALRADGTVIAWGGTNFSQSQTPALTQSIGLIAAGSVHSLAVLGQPFQRTALAGDATTFSAGQFANRLATFQWQFNGANISGATNSSLTLGNVCWTNSGIYRVVISNPLGSLTSPAMSLSVSRGPLRFDPSSVFYQPTNGAVQMRLTGSSGVNPVVIYATTNLLDWLPVFTNSPTTNPIEYIDVPSDSSSHRFYRAIEQP